MSTHDTPRTTTSTGTANDPADRSHSLDAWIDGDLDIDRKMQVAGWLAEDRDLTVELMELEDLARRSSRLSPYAEPGNDLWPAIAERLDAADAASSVDDSAGRFVSVSRNESRGWRPAPWATSALAALLGVAAGAWLMAGLGTSSPASVSDDAGGSSMQATTSRASGTPLASVVRPAASTGVGNDAVEAAFLEAREGLWLQLLAQRDSLPPETWEAVVENLTILDSAIRDLRQALDQDPGNPRLERMLVDNHQRSLDLLHRLARSA